MNHAAKERTMKRTLRRTISSVVVITTIAVSLPAPAHAAEFSGVISLADRERVELLLTEHGVQAAEARARAAALTDKEANQLAAGIDALPAGGTGEDVANGLYGMVILGLMVFALVGFLIIKAIEAAKSTGSPANDAGRPVGGPAPNPAPY
jgi:Family of unknown function (DUF6627)